MRSRGQFTPKDAFVLHPYGRYCNANKFAGEIDVLEALDRRPDAVSRSTRTGWSDARVFDGRRGLLAVRRALSRPLGRRQSRGGVLGDAAVPEGLPEGDAEADLVRAEALALYDCTGYAVNLFHCPTVAYSGENDSQKQAADMMAKALADGGHRPGPHHRRRRRSTHYTPDGEAEIERRIDSIARDSGRDRDPAARSASPPTRCATTACTGSRSTAWTSTGSAPGSRPTCSADTASNRDRSDERHRPDARIPRRVSARSTSAAGSAVLASTAIQFDGAPAALRPLVDRPLPRKVDGQWRMARHRERRRPRASGTACKGRSTTPSWTRFIMVRPTGKARHASRRQLGGGRAGPRRRTLAAAVPRRGPRQGRHQITRRRHRRLAT